MQYDSGMRFLLEFDGPVFDVAAAQHAAHRESAAAVGWSSLDAATFRRVTRSKGREADVLPGARDGKVGEYHRRFEELVESDACITRLEPHSGVDELLVKLARSGLCHFVTLGSNRSARATLLQRHGLSRFAGGIEALNADPRRRPAELRVLSGNDERTLVVAGGDTLARSASLAELFVVGITNGPCSADRLHRAGAAVVYKTLDDLLESLGSGAADLVRAGWHPAPLP